MIGGKFPRLTEPDPADRLAEVERMLGRLTGPVPRR